MSRSLFARLHRRFGARPSAPDRRRNLANRLRQVASAVEIGDAAHPHLLAERAGPRKSVVVVGGGLAGLMAARSLTRHFDVTLFEALDRVGGRVHTIRDDASKRLIEGGAELIGYCHPMWLRLAQHFDLGLSVWTSEGDFDHVRLHQPMFVNGHKITDDEAETIYQESLKANALMIEDAKAIKDPFKPWEADHAGELDSLSLAAWIDALPEACFSDLTKEALKFQNANTNGAAAENQSYLANLALVKGGAIHGDPGDFFDYSENVRCERGNDTLAFSLADDIRKRNGLVCRSAAVVGIDIGPDKVSITLEKGSKPVVADAVVLAVPPSVWKDIKITPALPDSYKMSMGTAVKYLTRSERRFWIADNLAPSAASDDIGVTWEGTDNQMQAAGQDVELTLFAGGPAADRALEIFDRLGPDGVQGHLDRSIGQIYKKYVQSRKPDPTFMAWPRKKRIETGYSCPAPGDVTKVAPNLDKAFHKRLFFAGEHVCLPFFGYMEGALQSGYRAAKKVTDAYGG